MDTTTVRCNPNNTNTSNNGKEMFDLFAILEAVRKNFLVILLCIVAFGAAFFIKSYYFTADTYTASGQLCVSNRAASCHADDNGVILKSDLDTARTLTSTYVELLKMREFLEQFSEHSESKTGWSAIRNMMHVSAMDSSDIMTVSVTAKSADLAYDLCRSIVECAPDRLQSVYEGGNASIVNKVYKPEHANSRGTLKTTAIGLLLGAVVVAAYAFLRMLFDRVIHHSADVSKRYGYVILGEIADVAQNVKNGRLAIKKTNTVEEQRLNILDEKSSFDMVETYKSIRTNIMFSVPKSDKGKIVVISSAAPSEGKSTTAVNLALTFAQNGVKVLLLDCDMRKPQMHRYLKLDRGDGISNILCGFTDLEHAIRRDVRPNFDVLTAGKTPPNPAELLDTAEFGNLLEQLKDEYDYIFIDTPPITVVTDAVLTMRYCQGVVVVVRENQTTFDLLDEAMQTIARTGVNVFGFVVDNAEEKNSKYGYYHRGKYGCYKRSSYTYGSDGSKIKVQNESGKQK